MSRGPRSRLGLVALGLTLAVGGCKDDEDATVLDPSDLITYSDRTFSPNVIVTDGELEEGAGGVDAVQSFLEGAGNPYGRASFLATYQSHGLRASDAVLSSARRWRLNPLLFLVQAQAAQGLIGQDTYPSPPERVEYVFDCGCVAAASCDVALAGFDRQVDCLGREIRAALDAIEAGGVTVSGFGPGVSTLTLDGVLVRPSNRDTAALYERTPTVADGKAGGTWLLWNLWNRYADVFRSADDGAARAKATRGAVRGTGTTFTR